MADKVTEVTEEEEDTEVSMEEIVTEVHEKDVVTSSIQGTGTEMENPNHASKVKKAKKQSFLS